MLTPWLFVSFPPRARPAGPGRRATVLAAGALALLAACRSDAPSPTAAAPGTEGAPAAAADVRELRDPLSQRLSSTPGACIVAVRTPQGDYRGRAVTVRVPAGIESGAAGTIRFGYRGWAAGGPEPALLAVCSIPDEPAARAYFATRFGGIPMNGEALRRFAVSAGVARAEEWGPWTTPHVMQDAGPVYITDGLASASPATRPERGADAGPMIIDGCEQQLMSVTSECGGWAPEDETIPDTPPPSDNPDLSLIADPDYSIDPVTGIVQACTGLTEYPHRSTTTGFVGRINVKSRNECPQSLPQFVSSTLRRQKCFLWVFCTWPSIAYGTDSRASSTWAEAKANTDCIWPRGWYMGEGVHRVTWPQGVGSTRTWSKVVGIQC